MALTITDTFETLAGVQTAGQVVTARPSLVPLFISGIERDTTYSLTTTTNSSGSWTIVLPDPSICDPSTVQWYITLPDNSIWKGAVPAGQTGPFTIQTLKNTYSWGLVSAGTPAQAGVAIQGPAGAAGGSPSYGLLSARPSAASAGDKVLYIATDVDGGTIYQVQSAAWVTITPGVTLIPATWLGTSSTTAAAGNDSRITGAVQVGGDIGGTTAAPTVTNLSHVTNASLPAAGIAVVNPSSLTGTGTVPAAGLPVATTAAFGAVKPDGTTVTIASGVISAVAGSGHTGTPTLGNAGTAVGTGPTLALLTGSVDTHGVIHVKTGTSCASSGIAVGGPWWLDVTFGAAFTNVPAVTLTHDVDSTLGRNGYFPLAGSVTTTGFRLIVGGTAVDAFDYYIAYSVQGT